MNTSVPRRYTITYVDGTRVDVDAEGRWGGFQRPWVRRHRLADRGQRCTPISEPALSPT